MNFPPQIGKSGVKKKVERNHRENKFKKICLGKRNDRKNKC